MSILKYLDAVILCGGDRLHRTVSVLKLNGDGPSTAVAAAPSTVSVGTVAVNRLIQHVAVCFRLYLVPAGQRS